MSIIFGSDNEQKVDQKKPKEALFLSVLSVEPAGVEPASKQVTKVLSTCLVFRKLSGAEGRKTNLIHSLVSLFNSKRETCFERSQTYMVSHCGAELSGPPRETSCFSLRKNSVA